MEVVMSQLDYLDEERKKLWNKVTEQKKINDSLQKSIDELTSSVAQVKTIAENKVSENEETALKSAQVSEANSLKITDILKQCEEVSGKVEVASKNLDKITAIGVECDKVKNDYSDAAAIIATLKSKSDAATTEIIAFQEKATKTAEDASAKWAKVSQNEDAAIKAVQTSEVNSLKIADIFKQCEEVSCKVVTANKNLDKIAAVGVECDQVKNDYTAAIAIISDLKSKSDVATKEIIASQEKATKATEDASVKWATVNQQAQNITNLEAAAKTNTAAIQASRDEVQKQQDEITRLKDAFIEMQNEWLLNFTEMQKKHSDELSLLHKTKEENLKRVIEENSQKLTELNKKYQTEFTERTKEINSLLPGATSAGLASAFLKRRYRFALTKIGWGILLFIGVLALITFGALSISSKFADLYGLSINGSMNTFYGRAIIFAALLLFEEFARRNFNIVSRLEESYAYKEVLARSYLGYKEQMSNVNLPSDNKEIPITGVSVLVKTFLENLADEPGKHVFDKEKHEIGPGAVIDRISPNSPDSASGKAIEVISQGNLLTKISWQIVAVVAILAIAGCIIAYLLRGQLL